MDSDNLFVKPTLDGEVVVKKEGENLIVGELRTVELGVVPSFIGQKHIDAMAKFHAALCEAKEEQKTRSVPLTRTEIFAYGIDKKAYKDLLEAGLLKERLVNFIRQSDKKPTGARATVYYTPQGRAFIRKHVDPSYALTGSF